MQRLSASSMLLMAAGMGCFARTPGPIDLTGLFLLLAVAGFLCRWRPMHSLLPLWLGVCYCAVYVEYLAPAALPAALEGERQRVTVHVRSIEQAPQGAERLALRATVDDVRFRSSDYRTSGRMLLAAFDPVPMQVGETWALTVRLRRPRGLVNPGGFDYASWAFAEGIVASGSIVDAAGARRLEGGGESSVRTELRAFLFRHVEPGPGRELLVALGVGDRSSMGPELRELLRATGTSHLFVVSGLHVGIVAATVLAVLSVTGLPLAVRALCAAAFVTGYAFVVGMGLPVQRALASALLVLGALLASRQLAVSRLFAAAVLAVCLLNPLASLLAAFWMSFGAVAVLLVTWSAGQAHAAELVTGAERVASDPAEHGVGSVMRVVREAARRAWRGTVLLFRVQVVLGIALAPLSLAWVGQWTPLALPANLVAVPVVTLLVVPLTLAATLLAFVWEFPAGLLAGLLADVLGALAVALDLATAATPRFLWPELAGPGVSVFWVTASLGAVLMTLPIPRAWRVTAAVLMLPVVMGRDTVPVVEPLRIEVLDVGQGFSVVLRSRNRTLVYDAGPRFVSGFDAGAAVVAPHLARAGVRRLDALIMSHADLDHAGGVEALRRQVHTLATYGPGRCVTRSWQWDGLSFELTAGRGHSRNDQSCVLLVDTGRQRVLLPGDIERGAETELLQRVDIRADLVVAPHHGSGTSSSVAFLNGVRPRVAVVSAGYRNRFGHPHPEVVARYMRRGAVVLSTADSGAVRIGLRDGFITTEPAVSMVRRPWLAPVECFSDPQPWMCRTVHSADSAGAGSHPVFPR